MNEIALHYTKRPRRSSLVLLPPFPLDSRTWAGVRQELADLPVITVDPPGFGASASPEDLARALGEPEEPSLSTYAKGVAAALERIGVEQIVLAGVSIGGYSAMAFAELFPERLLGLGLLDTNADSDTDERRADRLGMAEAVERGESPADLLASTIPSMVSPVTPAERPELHAELQEWYAQAPAAGVAWSQRAMAARPARLEVLRSLGIPALVVRGADDAVSTAEAADAMAEALSAEVVEVPDAGHLAATERPDAVAHALRGLWERALEAVQQEAAMMQEEGQQEGQQEA